MKARLIIVLSILGCIFSLSDTNILFDCEYGKEYVVDMTSLTEGYIPYGATLFFRLPIDTSNKSSITIKLLNEADYPSSLDVYFFSEKPSDEDAKNVRGSSEWVHRDSKEKDKTYTKYIYPIDGQYTGNYIVVTFRVYEDYHYFSFLVSPNQVKGYYMKQIEYNKEHIIENINNYESNYQFYLDSQNNDYESIKIKLHKDDSDLISGISVQLAGMKGSILTSMNDIIQMRSFVGSDIERFDNDYIEYIYKYYKLKDKVKTLYILVNSEYTLKYFSITVGNNNY